jgi:arylsulfatase A-like enzyme
MAAEGQKWTNFYAVASVCTPSRAGLLTGRYPIRSGMCGDKHRVLFPNSVNGIPQNEIILAEQLKTVGYQTACIGKWHLGHRDEYLPTRHGFDYYYGIPYSNDMDKTTDRDYWEFADSIPIENYNVPMMRGADIIERPVEQHTITRRYTDETIRFIRENKDRPFFLYLAHSFPHIPLFASADFRGVSAGGLYGDVIEELDHSTGRILEVLRQEGLAENTLVVFTSDNGPWLLFKTHGGLAGPLRAGKGTTYEGGMRVPAIFWWPSRIAPAIVGGIGCTMDLFTTFSRLAGTRLPDDRIIDGVDLGETLLRGGPSPRMHLLYYRGTQIYAARWGDFKAHFITQGAYGMFGEKVMHDPPLLYRLNEDPAERFDVAENYPEVLAEIRKIVDAHRQDLVPVKDQLAERE